MPEINVKLNPRKDKVLSLRYPGGHEVVSAVNEIQHPIIRRAFQKYGINTGVDLFAGSPANPDSFAVGLVHALHLLNGIEKSHQELSEEAKTLLA